jgi:hypothetical protein
MSDVRLTGGCQCGAVRYAVHSQPARPALCHCRMCQKASGNVFGSFAGVDSADFQVTRGEITWWVSSSGGERGFCRNCGTPLAWRNPEHTWTSMTIGSYDEPAKVKPIYVYGSEGIVPWLHEVMALVPTPTGHANTPQAKAKNDPHYEQIRLTNHQHPDHDTVSWTPHPAGVA